MNILIIGGGGMVGQKLAKALTARGALDGKDITAMTLADIVPPAPVEADFPVDTRACDITQPDQIAACLSDQTDMVYLLAAIVSGQAEAEFDTGMNINMFGVYHILERCRALGHRPRVVFSSSIAVYGGEAEDPVGDHSHLNPQTSYGMQKAIGEKLVTDYSRKGFLDGRAVRLPTISVRPGKANKAASSFMSSIFREPLSGKPAVCPVGEDFQHYYLSPKLCVENLIRIAEVPEAEMGQNRALQMPGRTWAIGEMVAAMTDVAGPEPATRITWEKDEDLLKIVGGWRYDIRAEKGLALGLKADDSFAENIRYFMEDDLPS